MINFRYIINILGRLLMVEGAGLALCIVIALLYGENDLLAFVYSSLITLGVGALMTFSVKVQTGKRLRALLRIPFTDKRKRHGASCRLLPRIPTRRIIPV